MGLGSIIPVTLSSCTLPRNIQRGRDHGLPTYADMREACGLRRLTSFHSTPREVPRDVWRNIKRVYRWPTTQATSCRDVRDIDLFTGGLAERPRPGAVVGPTFLCIIGRQFSSLLHGDR